MNKKILFGRSIKDLLLAFSPSVMIFIALVVAAYFYVDPAPPKTLVISTGDGEGDYQSYAEQYKALLKEDGVELEIRPSSGPIENLRRLRDDDSGVDVGFAPDGLMGSGSDRANLFTFGSVSYEPMWFFYRGAATLTRLSQLESKRIAVGQAGSGANLLSRRLLNEGGVNNANSEYVYLGGEAAANALKKGEVDAAAFLAPADDPIVEELLKTNGVRLMSLDQAEAFARQIPFLHHLVMPHGVIDFKSNVPAEDVHMLAPTATLVARTDVHPALVYLLLKAASKVHGGQGVFENTGEFPNNRDFTFELDPDAKAYYQKGAPFWQRYLPYWMAVLVDRFIIVAIPIFAMLIPLGRAIPKIYRWRVRTRIFQHYGELKFLETQIHPGTTPSEHVDILARLDAIDEKVNRMKLPLEFSELLYSLRGHIDIVRGRLARVLAARANAGTSVAGSAPASPPPHA